MTKALYILISVACIFAGSSCNREELSETFKANGSENADLKNYTAENINTTEFVSWCADEEHKLNKVKVISEMRYNLSYIPAQAMAVLELRTEEHDFSKFKTVSENYSLMSYFNFRIQIINGKGELLKHQLSSPAQYEARVKYFSFEMEKDICLVQGKDTIYPGLFQFERIFEVAPYATVIFAFDNKMFNKNEEFTIVYNDKVFEKGFIKFNYKNKQLINLPNITEL